MNICCIVHKFIHTPDLLPELINVLFCRNEQIHNYYNTIQRKDLHPVKIKTKLYGEKTISFQGTTLWNNLPNYIKEILSLCAFKPKLHCIAEIRAHWIETKPFEIDNPRHHYQIA